MKHVQRKPGRLRDFLGGELWARAGSVWARREKAENSSRAERLYSKGMLVKERDREEEETQQVESTVGEGA